MARNDLTPLARIHAAAVTGCPPEIMGMGPVPATRKALAWAGLSIDDIGIVELNEALTAARWPSATRWAQPAPA